MPQAQAVDKVAQCPPQLEAQRNAQGKLAGRELIIVVEDKDGHDCGDHGEKQTSAGKKAKSRPRVCDVRDAKEMGQLWKGRPAPVQG